MQLEMGWLPHRRRAVATPGVAVGVLVDGDRHFWCDGVTSVRHPIPVHEETLFQLGSVSKVVTATASLALVDRGPLSLSTRVADLLPDVELGPAGASLTIEHLLTHRGGWQGDWSLFNSPPGHDADALRRMIRQAPLVPRYSPPGGPFSYDNFGTCVLGGVVEEQFGAPFDEAVNGLVLRPLGLSDSSYWADDAIWKRVAVGHTADGRLAAGTEPWADMWPTRRAIWPQGGLVASVADALTFAAFHATGAAIVPPMSSSALLDMHTERATSGGQGSAVALGWHVQPASGIAVLTHSGAGQGFFARMVVVPSRQSALVVLTNSAGGFALVDEVVDWYLRDIVDLRVDPPPIEKAPANAESLVGDYEAVTREISVEAVSARSLTARVTDTGPTWAGSHTHELTFREGQRLIAADGTRMEYGRLDDGTNWIRYRGRVHIRMSKA